MSGVAFALTGNCWAWCFDHSCWFHSASSCCGVLAIVSGPAPMGLVGGAGGTGGTGVGGRGCGCEGGGGLGSLTTCFYIGSNLRFRFPCALLGTDIGLPNLHIHLCSILASVELTPFSA